MIVLDCSFLMAGMLEDERTARAQAVFDQLALGKVKAVVPKLLLVEAANVVVNCARRGRINRLFVAQYVDLFQSCPLEIEHDFRMQACVDLAMCYDLSVYDATYLELAIRKNCSLATLDKKLMAVANSLGLLFTA